MQSRPGYLCSLQVQALRIQPWPRRSTEADDALVFKAEALRVRLSLPFCSKKSARFVKITALGRVDRSLSWCHVKDAALTKRDAYMANRLAFLMVRGPLQSNATANIVSVGG
jgi:hypothetical protein